MAAIWVFLGGGTGAVLRWWLSGLAASPWGTMGVNILGSAMLAGLMHPEVGLQDPWKLALGTGLMGGFTTYSTFNLDVWMALQSGDTWRAGVTLLGTVFGCLLGAALGWALAGSIVRP
jgi:CrcB protein